MRETSNMRSGFTMIELIFVIVIIGILAAVAIPKLAATRDDAKLSKEIANAKICINDAGSAYTAGTTTDLSGGYTSAACDAAYVTVQWTWTENSVSITGTGTDLDDEVNTFGGTSVVYN